MSAARDNGNREARVQDATLTHDDVAHLAGGLEVTMIAAILATGATNQEIEQALNGPAPERMSRVSTRTA